MARQVPATLREVSEKLNLSPGLVSRVLNKRPGVRAAPSTIARIQQYAREMNYEPSAAAQSLRLGKTNIVAFVFLQSSEQGVRSARSEAAEAMAESLQSIGYSVLIKVFADEEEMRGSLRTMARQRVCDAVVMWVDEAAAEGLGEVLIEVGMPFVLKGRLEKTRPEWLQVDYDHEAMMAACVRRLAGMGHEKIAFIGFIPVHVYQRALVDGFCAAMETTTGRCDSELVASVSLGLGPATAQMQKWLALPASKRPTAVVIGASDNPFWSVELALAKAGRKLGYGSGDFAAAGSIKPGAPLLFGEAEGYASTDASLIAITQAERQLIPLLKTGSCDEQVVRILPELKPLASLRLGDVAQAGPR